MQLYAKKTHQRLVFAGIADPVIVWWVDASYNITTCEGRLGWEVQVLDVSEMPKGLESLPRSNLVAWKSRRCKRKLASTTSAELMALLEGVKAAPAYARLVQVLWGKKPKVVFVTDNQPMLGWLRTGWVQTDPAFQGVLDLVRGRIEELCAEVLWVRTSEQRADRQTKFIPVRIRE